MKYARNICNCIVDEQRMLVVISGRYYDDATRSRTVVIPLDAWKAMEGGTLIQVACPTMSDDDREFLISGMSPEGWAKLFGGKK